MFTELNSLVYALRRQAWVLQLPRLLGPPRPALDRPTFLLGVQGGGLTLASRMLRRHPSVISVTGGSGYWAGADELQNVLDPILPTQLRGLTGHVPPDSLFPGSRGSSYAVDRLLDAYRFTAADATPELERQFKRILGWLARRHAHGDPASARLVDKSQTFTVRVALIRALLADWNPHFVLIGRDPHASSLRSLRLAEYRDHLPASLGRLERLELAAQHWNNSMSCALEDADGYEYFMTMRFEDLLEQPEVTLRRMCAFVGLDFRPEMLPAEGHRLPVGARRRDRWWPLRTDVNGRYLNEETEEERAVIERVCGRTARRLGYA